MTSPRVEPPDGPIYIRGHLTSPSLLPDTAERLDVWFVDDPSGSDGMRTWWWDGEWVLSPEVRAPSVPEQMNDVNGKLDMILDVLRANRLHQEHCAAWQNSFVIHEPNLCDCWLAGPTNDENAPPQSED